MTKEIKEEKLENTSDNKPKRDKKGRLLPGCSGNPKGKPKGTLSLVSLLKRELQGMTTTDKGEKLSYADVLIKKILKKAIVEEDVQMIKDILNRVDGMPKQAIDLSGEIKNVEVTDKEVRDYKKWRKSRI